MNPDEFLVPCVEGEDGDLTLHPLGGVADDGDVRTGDRCVIVDVLRVGGAAVSAVVRNLSRGGMTA